MSWKEADYEFDIFLCDELGLDYHDWLIYPTLHEDFDLFLDDELGLDA